MRVKVLRSFVDRVHHVRASRGDVVDLPDGADWLRAGLVAPLKATPVETAVAAAAAETAIGDIKGISPPRVAALATAGINNLEDLAAANADEVAAMLARVSSKMAAGWIREAIKRVANGA